MTTLEIAEEHITTEKTSMVWWQPPVRIWILPQELTGVLVVMILGVIILPCYTSQLQ